jgi:anti-sigma regulatory factor (Ser/Thr protein kinase)
MSPGTHNLPAPTIGLAALPACSGHAMTCYATFPGRADQVSAARRFVAEVLAGCPAGPNAVLAANELITNAVVHTASGWAGHFRVAVTHRSGDVRIEVADQGGQWQPGPPVSPGPDAEDGRGLLVVASLVRAWGVTGDDSGRVVWFELDCAPGEPAEGTP